MAHDFNGANAGDHSGDGGGGIPLSKLEGNWASSPGQQSITLCFKPDFSATEACSTAGAVGAAFNDPAIGTFTQDKAGNFCGTSTDVLSFPGDVHPPTVTVQNTSGKSTSYDPATGSGDSSIALYSGGKCQGSNFDKTGATLNVTATAHVVASDNGKRVDVVITSVADPVNGVIGAFSITGVNLKQQK